MPHFSDQLTKWENLLSGLAVVGIVVAVSLQVFFRFVLSMPIPWVEEFGRYLHIWVVFLGAAAAEGSGYHIRVDYFANKIFHGRLATVQQGLLQLITLVVATVLLWSVLQALKKLSTVTTATMGLPMTLFYVPTVLGGLGLFVHALLNASILIRDIHKMPVR